MESKILGYYYWPGKNKQQYYCIVQGVTRVYFNKRVELHLRDIRIIECLELLVFWGIYLLYGRS